MKRAAQQLQRDRCKRKCSAAATEHYLRAPSPTSSSSTSSSSPGRSTSFREVEQADASNFATQDEALRVFLRNVSKELPHLSRFNLKYLLASSPPMLRFNLKSLSPSLADNLIALGVRSPKTLALSCSTPQDFENICEGIQRQYRGTSSGLAVLPGHYLLLQHAVGQSRDLLASGSRAQSSRELIPPRSSSHVGVSAPEPPARLPSTEDDEPGVEASASGSET